jgi:tetratricopeptide (TPR) repeat protein
MAAKTGRYTIYYVSIAAMVLGRETDILLKHLLKERTPDRIYTKIVFAFSILALLSSTLFFIGVFKFQWLRLDIARRSYVPVSSVDFIEKNRLSGNILNSHPYGGYVTWRLYPWKMTFIDTRWLNPTVQREYGWMMNAIESVSVKKLHQGKLPLWKRLLNHYDINFILYDTLDVHGNVPKLLLTLAEDKEWVPVYCEPIAIIFIRNTQENHDIIEKFRRPKEEVYNTIIGIASQIAIYDRLNPSYLVTLGKTFYEMGRLKDALIAYQYALRRVPNDSIAKEKITQIESELKQDKSNEKH